MVRYWIFRSATVIVPPIPIWISRPLASFGGFLLWALAPGARRQVERNLRHVPALSLDPAALYWATRGVFQHTALNYLDFFRGASISETELKAGWTIVNQAAYDEALAEGRGLVLIGAHFGNFELAASRLGALGYKLLTPVERMKPEPLFELFCRIRQHHNLRLVPADSRDSLREMLETLKRGEVVMFLADRYILGASTAIPFFDEPAKMPTGPMALAIKSGAPVIMAYSWREGPGRAYGAFVRVDIAAAAKAAAVDSAEVSTGAEGLLSRAQTATRVRTADLAAEAHEKCLQVLERAIEQHPEQWVATLWPIWNVE